MFSTVTGWTVGKAKIVEMKITHKTEIELIDHMMIPSPKLNGPGLYLTYHYKLS
jgi:hypothetical protein